MYKSRLPHCHQRRRRVCEQAAKGFYVGCTIEKFADNITDRAREQILANEMLSRFPEISNERYRTKAEKVFD